MKLFQRKFIEFALKKKALDFGKFVLKSGRKSPYFFNISLFNTGYDLDLLGNFCAKALVNSGINFDVLFGQAYKGIPIAISTAMLLAKKYKRDVSYCFNRKEKKDHGEEGYLVGNLMGGRIILVDDVITTGTTIRDSAKIMKKNNMTIAGILIMLDRQEKGCKENYAIQEIEHDYNFRVTSIITLRDIIEYLEFNTEMIVHLEQLTHYRKRFGI